MFGAQVLDHLVGVGEAVWRASWQASVLAVLVVAVQLIFGKRIAARWRHAMWMLVLVRLALPVVPSSPLSVFNLAPAKGPVLRPAPLAPIERGPIARTMNSLRATVVPLAASRTDRPSPAKPQAAVPIASVPPQDLWMESTQVLAILWAMGASLLAIRIAWATWRVSRALRRLDPVEDPAIHDVLRSTAAELRVRRLPRLLAGDGLFSPALVGFIRPKLLVPRDLLASFEQAELRLVFLHELGHLKRRDIAVNWAATVLTVLHWLNPVAWLVVWRLRLERELACDELVMSRTSDADRCAYGHTIVKLLETFSHGHAARQPMGGAVGILEGKAQMKRRITMIAHFAKSSRAWTVVAATLVLTLGLVALTDAVQAEEPAKRTPAGAQDSNSSTRPTSQRAMPRPNGSLVNEDAFDDANTAAVGDDIPEALVELLRRRAEPGEDEIQRVLKQADQAIVDQFAQRDFRGRIVNQPELESKMAERRAALVAAIPRLRQALRPTGQPTDSPTNEEIAQSDPTMREYVQQLARLEDDRRRNRLGEGHPTLLKLDSDIEATRKFIALLGAQRRKQLTQPTKLKPGDLVAVSIMDLTGQGIETMKTARIDGDGTINLPYAGAVKANGLSPVELEKAVAKALRDGKVVENAMVAVSMPERGESHQLTKRAEPFLIAEPNGAEGMWMDPAMMGMEAPDRTAPPAQKPITKAYDVADLASSSARAREQAVRLRVDREQYRSAFQEATKNKLSAEHVEMIKSQLQGLDIQIAQLQSSDDTDLVGDRLKKVTEIIQRTAAPETWRDAGGTIGSISVFGNRLIITTTEPIHIKVANLLAILRDADTEGPTSRTMEK